MNAGTGLIFTFPRSICFNAMMYDFGFDNSEEDENVIQGWIDYLDRTFDLVLITDYFDESMVLMKVSFTVVLY